MDDPFQQVLSFITLNNTTHLSYSIEVTIASIFILILLVCSALISGSEVACFSLSPADKENLSNNSDRKSVLLTSLLEKPKRLLATILIINNFVNVAIVILSTFLLDLIIDDSISETMLFVLQVVIVTFLLLLIGEVIPKIYANKNPLVLSNFMAIPIYFLRILLTPLSSLLVNSTNFIDKRVKKRGHNISVDELSQALELTSDDNEKEDDQKILKGIVKFGNTDVKQVMTPRVDVLSIEEETEFKEVIQQILDSGYSRIPVHKENFDNISGILYTKDLLPHLKEDKFDWKSIIRKPFFVPENKKIDDLLREFQTKKIHVAIVVDEYGGSSGLISLEDILEEIVGEISDEFDDDELAYSKIDERNYVFEGKTTLIDVYKVLNIDGDEFEAEKGESDTLAGLVLELFGKIPKKNEKFKFNDYQITIEAADKRRIKHIRLTLPENKAD